jgi:tetratricopeptide (TPR) repeat protein
MCIATARHCSAANRRTEIPTVRPRRPLVVATVLVLLAVAMPAVADYWYEHYARAEAALADDNWSLAVEELLEALERKGDSGARVRSYGMKVIAYFPYLRLGIAYHHLGQLEAALQAFETEERLGAIQSSETGLEDLERYRALTIAALEASAASETERISQIVRDSVREAEILERQDRLQEAMDTLGKALAVDPENAETLSRMAILRAEVVRLEDQHDRESRAAELVSRGATLLEKKQYGEASSVLRQALALDPDAETRRLLGRAQAGLLAEVQAERNYIQRRTLIDTGLAEARQLEGSGAYPEALDRLQPVLAMDPGNREAGEIQDRILLARRDAERRDSIARRVATAESELSSGRFEGAISAANRVLALDPGNTAALSIVRDAYREVSRRLLGPQTIGNIPPAIRFADFRTEREDGTRVQLSDVPDFQLSGVIIDNSPVNIVFRGPGELDIEGVSSSQPVGEYFVTEFSLSDRLVSGESVYQLVVTDNAGLTSSAEYAVVFTPPFYKTGWFKAASLAVPLAALGGIWLRRARRRNRLVRRRFNPYIAGAPVLDTRLFFGRDRLVERILQTIHNNSLLLYGERRIGKTSLQHHLLRRLRKLEDPQYDFYPVYIDLQGTPEGRFFATLAEDVFHELAPVLGALEPGKELASGGPYGYRELVRDLRLVMKALEAGSTKTVKLVLLIDEVDELNDYDPRTNQKLRSLFMKSFADNLVAVVSGVEIRKQWEKEGSPWYNFFEEINVAAIEREDAESLIRRPIEGVFGIDNGVVDRIIEITGCKPYAIQSLCIAVVNRLHEQNRRTITLEDVEAVGGSSRR